MRKFLSAPLAVLVLAAAILVSVPSAGAHDKYEWVEKPKTVCELQWQHVRVVTHYVDIYGNRYSDPLTAPIGAEPLWPAYTWKQELRNVCRTEYESVYQLDQDHYLWHAYEDQRQQTKEVCTWTLTVAGVGIVARYGTYAAAMLASITLSVSTTGAISIDRVCEWVSWPN